MNYSQYIEILTKCKNKFLEFFNKKIFCGIILGSGYNDLVNYFNVVKKIDYSDLIHFPYSTVPGHSNKINIVEFNNYFILFFQGRVHLYEGYSPYEVSIPVALLGELGVKNIIITNASGGINKKFTPGDIMLIEDHINLQSTSPLIGISDGKGFIDMTNCYDQNTIKLISKNFNVHKGIYAGLIGPNYETPAEIKFLKKIGADAVGMSTIMESIMAKFYNMRILGISLITNKAAGLTKNKISHNEVTNISKKSLIQIKNIINYTIEFWRNNE